MTQARRALGARGEGLVADWYEQRGYRVIARNWRCRAGELDLIVARGRQVVFCEVKARTSDAFGLPAEAVTRTKQTRLRLLAATWLDTDAPWPVAGLRFDVASVLAGVVDVIEGAF